MSRISINLQNDIHKIKDLKVGDAVLLTGTMYTARDQAHKRIQEDIESGKEIAFDIKNSAIYYVGPTPTKEGNVIGAAGPTTSYRMDKFTPFMLANGMKIMIGKGKRDDGVINAIKEQGGVYLSAIGGTAAKLAQSIKSCEVIMYEELMSEAVRRIEVVDFPAIVTIDNSGNDFFRQ